MTIKDKYGRTVTAENVFSHSLLYGSENQRLSQQLLETHAIQGLPAKALEQQKRELEKALSKQPFKSTDTSVVAGRIAESRRLAGDTYTTYERAFIQIELYNQTLKEINRLQLSGVVLDELLLNWVNILSVAEIATLLTFTQEDVTSLKNAWKSPQGSLTEVNYSNEILEKVPYLYLNLLAVLAEDNIVPMVVTRDQIMKINDQDRTNNTDTKPRLEQVMTGAKRYKQRELKAISTLLKSDELRDQGLKRQTVLEEQEVNMFSSLEGMNRAPKQHYVVFPQPAKAEVAAD